MNETAAPTWVGKITLGDDWAVYSGKGGITPPHRHLAFKWVVGLETPVRVQRAAGSRRSFLDTIAPNEEHRVDTDRQPLALIYLEPGKTLLPNALRDPTAFRAALASPEKISQWLRANTKVQTFDPRLRQATEHLRAQTPLTQLAPTVGLSPSRLTHLFSEALFAPPARYRLWYRLRSALAMLSAGASITEAAHETGFADSAHLTRSCTRMLGITPSTFRESEVTAS